ITEFKSCCCDRCSPIPAFQKLQLTGGFLYAIYSNRIGFIDPLMDIAQRSNVVEIWSRDVRETLPEINRQAERKGFGPHSVPVDRSHLTVIRKAERHDVVENLGRKEKLRMTLPENDICHSRRDG